MPATVSAVDFFSGRGLVVVPHMDDEALACGGTLAQLPDKSGWHLVYATDGRGSPEPVIPWRDQVSPDLGLMRQQEARAAMLCLGVPQANIHFLNLPDGRLPRHRAKLRSALALSIARLQPDHVLVPFRFDRHPDHLALNHVLLALLEEGHFRGPVTEYFVYHHWRLLPSRDVRQYIRPSLLRQVDISPVAMQKRAALALYKSQTTCFYPWQARPNLMPAFLDAVCQAPEIFLRYDANLPGAAIFSRHVTWIRVAHRLEPFLKKRKDRMVAWWQRGMGGG